MPEDSESVFKISWQDFFKYIKTLKFNLKKNISQIKNLEIYVKLYFNVGANCHILMQPMFFSYTYSLK